MYFGLDGISFSEKKSISRMTVYNRIKIYIYNIMYQKPLLKFEI